MHYGAYNNLRDSSWNCLIDFGVSSLPIDVMHIARSANIKVIKNSVVGELQPSESGLSMYDGDKWYIIYDDENTVERSRFTLAHELGHIFLGHELRKGYYARGTTFDVKPVIEREADMFAARLLCPSCVLWGLNVHSANDISRVCRVSHTVALIRAERMEVLYERNKFLLSPLERTVYNNFKNYIENNKGL